MEPVQAKLDNGGGRVTFSLSTALKVNDRTVFQVTLETVARLAFNLEGSPFGSLRNAKTKVLLSLGEQLISRYIEPNPHKPGRAEARVARYGVPVWALASHLKAANWDVARVAAAYGLPQEAVEAARAYYRKYKAIVDARISANEE